MHSWSMFLDETASITPTSSLQVWLAVSRQSDLLYSNIKHQLMAPTRPRIRHSSRPYGQCAADTLI